VLIRACSLVSGIPRALLIAGARTKTDLLFRNELSVRSPPRRLAIPDPS
jgi:hypothetical protein